MRVWVVMFIHKFFQYELIPDGTTRRRLTLTGTTGMASPEILPTRDRAQTTTPKTSATASTSTY
jgi:hypothetical protein